MLHRNFKVEPKNYTNLRIKARKISNSWGYSNNRYYKEIMLHEFLMSCMSNRFEEFPYTTNFEIMKSSIDLFNVKLPLKRTRHNFRNPKFWIGVKNTITPLHKDSTDNFSYQLFGRKRWSFYSIKENNKLYYSKNKYGTYENKLASFEISEIDMGNVNYNRFPLVKDLKKMEIITFPGDFLFIPYGWGHYVHNIENTFMINIWYKLDNYIPLILKNKV